MGYNPNICPFSSVFFSRFVFGGSEVRFYKRKVRCKPFLGHGRIWNVEQPRMDFWSLDWSSNWLLEKCGRGEMNLTS